MYNDTGAGFCYPCFQPPPQSADITAAAISDITLDIPTSDNCNSFD